MDRQALTGCFFPVFSDCDMTTNDASCVASPSPLTASADTRTETCSVCFVTSTTCASNVTQSVSVIGFLNDTLFIEIVITSRCPTKFIAQYRDPSSIHFSRSPPNTVWLKFSDLGRNIFLSTTFEPSTDTIAPPPTHGAGGASNTSSALPSSSTSRCMRLRSSAQAAWPRRLLTAASCASCHAALSDGMVRAGTTLADFSVFLQTVTMVKVACCTFSHWRERRERLRHTMSTVMLLAPVSTGVASIRTMSPCRMGPRKWQASTATVTYDTSCGASDCTCLCAPRTAHRSIMPSMAPALMRLPISAYSPSTSCDTSVAGASSRASSVVRGWKAWRACAAQLWRVAVAACRAASAQRRMVVVAVVFFLFFVVAVAGFVALLFFFFFFFFFFF
eukprot:Rhum_TRINITY_DN183_c0_g1::Rhum_TRINITY_DN183_c0_g1_i1::g.607::m.607